MLCSQMERGSALVFGKPGIHIQICVRLEHLLHRVQVVLLDGGQQSEVPDGDKTKYLFFMNLIFYGINLIETWALDKDADRAVELSPV